MLIELGLLALDVIIVFNQSPPQLFRLDLHQSHLLVVHHTVFAALLRGRLFVPVNQPLTPMRLEGQRPTIITYFYPCAWGKSRIIDHNWILVQHPLPNPLASFRFEKLAGSFKRVLGPTLSQVC